MDWNSTPNTKCSFSDFYNVSSDGNSSENLHGALLNFYNCFHEQLTVKDKAEEILGKPLGIISFIICCLSLLANITSVIVITKMSPKKSMHLKLIISLCLSDSLISFSILFDDFLYIFTSWDSCTRLSMRLLLDLALLATLLNLFAMALDHYLAIIKPIHYRQLMTKFQMNCIIIGIWVVCMSAVIVEVFVGLALQADSKRKALCDSIESGQDNLEIFIIGLIFVVLIGIVLIYIRIYSRISTVMPQREMRRCQTDSGSFKALVTSLLFIGTFVLLWVPIGCCQIVLHVLSKTDKEYVSQHIERFTLVNDVLFIILQLNSLADPLIYAFRLPKVQTGCATVFSCRRKPLKKCESSMLTKRYTSVRGTNISKESKVENKNHEESDDDRNEIEISKA